MRLTAVAIAVATQLFVASAFAAGGSGGKGDTGQKGGTGPSAAKGPAETDADAEPAEPKQQRRVPLGVPADDPTGKVWQIGLGAEFHRLLVTSDLGGAGAYKSLAAYSAFFRYSLTKHDKLTLSESATQKFIADEGETGLRLGDLSLAYSHHFPLPEDFDLFAGLGLTAPTGYYSQKASLYTAPRASLNLTKAIGYLGLGARVSGGTFLYHYRQAEGGGVNPKWRLSFALEADLQMPFHEPLSIGASAGTAYLWSYEPSNQLPPGAPNQGRVLDPNFPTQPFRQSYGGEIYARYVFPTFGPGIKMDATFAYAQADPELGFASLLRDGVVHTYPLFTRYTSSVYGALSAR